MSNSWSGLNAKQKSGITAALEALTALDTLSQAIASGPPAPRIAFRDLLAWTKGPAVNLPIAYKQALLANPTLRRDFDRLLAKTAEWRCERAAAASSGLLDTRDGSGFRVRLKPSRAAQGQVYLLIEFTGDVPVAPPRSLAVTCADGDCVRLELPEFRDGSAQLLSDENAEVVRLLRDPKTEIFLW